MQQVTHGNLILWQFEKLGKEKDVKHFVTSRHAPDSPKGFTLSYSSTQDSAMVTRHRKHLVEAIGIPATNLHIPSQVHGTSIAVVTAETVSHDLLETDSLITNVPNIAIAVLSADCVPILLFDRKNMAIGAVHAGWRGTVLKILEKTLHKMQQTFGTQGRDLVVAIGPSVSRESYEVGDDVVQAVNNAFEFNHGLLVPLANGKAKLDLWNANRLQLDAFGVPTEMIEVSDLCTVKYNADFFSARMGDSGRFAAGIALIP